jgi:predicted transcriptional regulator
MQTFNKLIQRKIDIEKQVDFFSNYLQKFPVNELGLITEKCEKYKFAKIGFDHWFKKLQEINIFINRNYKKEYKNYITEKRKNKLTN